MSELTGSIGWVDMTVDDASGVKDFYAQVVGFRVEATDMGDYEDFTLRKPESGDAVAGICHARGANADIPPGWLVYFVVDDLDEGIRRCEKLGGELLMEPRAYGDGRYCIVRDPAGIASALYQA